MGALQPHTGLMIGDLLRKLETGEFQTHSPFRTHTRPAACDGTSFHCHAPHKHILLKPLVPLLGHKRTLLDFPMSFKVLGYL